MNANFSTKFSLKKTVEKFDKGGGVSSVTKISESSFRLVKRWKGEWELTSEKKSFALILSCNLEWCPATPLLAI